MSCSNNFHDYISNCNDELKVNALLLPATPYTWIIIDKFGRQYSGVSISDADGFIKIAISDLPNGFFTEFSGEFILHILDPEDDCRKLDFKMAKFYDGVVFSVKGGERVKDALGCHFDCTQASGGASNSAVFPFNNVANVVIPWTSLLKGLYGNAPIVQVYFETSPNVFQLQNGLSISMVGGPYALTEIDIDNGGLATGYVLISE